MLGCTFLSEVLNRNLLHDAAAGQYFWVPTGEAPTKNEPRLRQSRAYFVAKTYLSEEWGSDLETFLEEDYTFLCRYHGKPEGPMLDPPARPSLGEKGLFGFFEYTWFRKSPKRCAGATSTDVRGVPEAYLQEEVQTDPKSLQHFVAHSEPVSAKHHWRKSSKQISRKLAGLYHSK